VDQAQPWTWQNRAQFLGVAARLMRHILVDHARGLCRGKRGGGVYVLPLDEGLTFSPQKSPALVALDDGAGGQLRASHINQQHNIRWQVKNLPEKIADSRKYHAAVTADIGTRDAHDGEFTMTVGNREFSGKGAREDAGNALNTVVMSWRDDRPLKSRGQYKGFEFLSRGSQIQDGIPDLFIRGKETYKANLNPDSPQGTIASIEHVLRGLDRKAEEELHEFERQEKALADYRAQLNKPFEHEARLKDLLAKQAQLNAALDLDKHEAQVVADAPEPEQKAPGFIGRIQAQDIGAAIAP
jgi:hypothetical protein